MTQQQQPRIGIVIGSTREGRFGEKPAHWIHEIAKQRTDLAFELIDLRDHPLPFFNEPRSPAYGPVNNEAARLWAGKLATLDGLIVVTPEYNHGPSAARAVEQLRLIAIELQMAPVAHAVHIGMVESLGIMQQGKTFEDFPHLAQAANRLLDDMSWWTKVLKPAREGMTTGVAGREQRGQAVTVTA